MVTPSPHLLNNNNNKCITRSEAAVFLIIICFLLNQLHVRTKKRASCVRKKK